MEATLSDWFVEFLIELRDSGWGSVFQAHEWHLDASTSQDAISVDYQQPGFEDFSVEGNQAIQPGDPGMSLLFHGLSSPGVQHGSIASFASLEDLENLENYIYSLSPLSIEESRRYTPLVMASEHRAASTTPHRAHADMLYSRTGIGRVGTEESEYDPSRRCFTTLASDPTGTRVQPVRFSVYLCEAKNYDTNEIGVQGEKHSRDEKRTFWLPKHKLFAGTECIVGCDIRLSYGELHESEKLRRMVTHGGLKLAGEFDVNSPPFYYSSSVDDFLTCSSIGSSVRVERHPSPFVEIAKQKGKIVTFKVPPETNKWARRVYNNRRYTSLRVGQRLAWAALDLGLNWAIDKVSDKRVFLSPRRAGEFTNIRHVLDQNGDVKDPNLIPGKEFKKQNRAGNYDAIMYQDGISEGVVSCSVSGLQGKPIDALPAWSLITAPDFMPRVGNIDLYEYKENFTIGGPKALCEGRLAVNSRLRIPGTQSQAFSRAENTMTSVVSLSRNGAGRAQSQPSYDVTHVLADRASDIFAPGWEVTYNRDSLLSYPYYHTAGLGSPFLEDVKLCAAANGMWPAASPDAARTFKRSTRTALPLTDEEIGLAPDSPRALRGGASGSGWDGEYGPFITEVGGRWHVNYSGIDRSDYVTNGLKGKVDFSRLRLLSEAETSTRMDVLRRVNRFLLNGTELSKSPYWLVCFQEIESWNAGEEQFNVPDALSGALRLLLRDDSVDVPGFFMVFATYSRESSKTDDLKRRLQPIDSLTLVRAAKGEEPVVSRVAAEATS